MLEDLSQKTLADPGDAAAAAPAPAPRPWTQETGERLRLSSARQYCALIELSGLEASFGSSDAVARELSAVMRWRSLMVWDRPELVPERLPLTGQPKQGRYWLAGRPDVSATIERDPRIVDLWSRAA
jgi:hypothetical protein